jgi:hypothetical protein
MGLVDYSDLEKEIANAPEPSILPAGSEVKDRIISVREGVSDKNNAQYYQPVFDVPSQPMVTEFNDFFWDLRDRDKIDPKQFQRNLNHFKTFAASFDIDYSKPFSWTDDLQGHEGWVVLGYKKDDEYGDKNTVKRYIKK